MSRKTGKPNLEDSAHDVDVPESQQVTADEASVGAAELGRKVADAVRALRRGRGFTLDDLATQSGVSRATLSQIESCKTNPTLAVLWRIAAALGVPFSALLGQEAVGQLHVLRRASQRLLMSADGQMQSRALSPAGISNVEVYELLLAPRAVRASEAHAPGTVEILIALTGTVRLTVEREVTDLSPGDSAYFRADVTHGYENRGRVEARCHDIIIYKA
jgi:transcriptional regulator with XRE-family HTH domain